MTQTGPINLADPWATYPGGNPFPVPFDSNAPFVKTGQFEAQQPDAKGTTVYSWNFSVQRQIGNDVLLSATYMGNQTAHIWGSFQLNPAVILPCPGGAPISTCNTTGNVNQRRVAFLANPVEGQYLGAVNQLDASGTGSYHGMLLVAQKRLSRGVSLNANYTYSHCLADLNQGSIVGGFTDGYLDPNNVALDNGALVIDTPAGTFDGGEILSTSQYGYGTYTASMRCATPRGTVCAFFLYQGVRGKQNDEVDIELLGGSSTIYFTTWVRGRRTNHVELTLPFDPGSTYHTYSIEYRASAVTFRVDGQILKAFTRKLPTQPMLIMSNAWWPTWLSGSSTGGSLDIDWITAQL